VFFAPPLSQAAIRKKPEVSEQILLAVLKGSRGGIQDLFPVFDKDESFSRLQNEGTNEGTKK
jgi:hypothetical protein